MTKAEGFVKRSAPHLCGLVLLAAAVVSIGVMTARAQDNGNGSVEVYVMRTPPGGVDGAARLFFIDAVTGETITADVSGDRFSIVGDYVLYQDPASQTVFRAWPDGRTEPHPFIQPAPETVRLDWVVSPNRQWIAWTLVDRVENDALQTVTTLTRADGTNPRVIMLDGPDAFLQVVPLALTNEGIFFFDRQPQGVGDYFFYPQYASIHRLDTDAEVPTPELLPFEPNCFCGAGLSADGHYFARLERLSDDGGYDVRLWDLPAGVDVEAPSLAVSYQTAGGVLVAPDGRRVVYSLANNLTIDSVESGRERFMLAVVDRDSGSQRPALFNQFLVPLLPVAWTEDGSGVILTNPRQDGTWKLILETGEVRQVAGGTLVGVIR